MEVEEEESEESDLGKLGLDLLKYTVSLVCTSTTLG